MGNFPKLEGKKNKTSAFSLRRGDRLLQLSNRKRRLGGPSECGYSSFQQASHRGNGGLAKLAGGIGLLYFVR